MACSLSWRDKERCNEHVRTRPLPKFSSTQKDLEEPLHKRSLVGVATRSRVPNGSPASCIKGSQEVSESLPHRHEHCSGFEFPLQTHTEHRLGLCPEDEQHILRALQPQRVDTLDDAEAHLPRGVQILAWGTNGRWTVWTAWQAIKQGAAWLRVTLRAVALPCV